MAHMGLLSPLETKLSSFATLKLENCQACSRATDNHESSKVTFPEP